MMKKLVYWQIHPAILIDSYALKLILDKMFNQIEPQADFKTISRFLFLRSCGCNR